MQHLISQGDILAITGLDDVELASLIPYAESQAKAMLGFLNKETKTETHYITDLTDVIKLDHSPINSITSIEYKTSADSTAEVVESSDYRFIADQGLIILDVNLQEGYTVDITYEVGWDQTTVTPLVKVFLVILTLVQYYSLRPDKAISSQQIVSEKIGDYTVRYTNMRDATYKSLEDWLDHLAMLIKKEGNYPEVS